MIADVVFRFLNFRFMFRASSFRNFLWAGKCWNEWWLLLRLEWSILCVLFDVNESNTNMYSLLSFAWSRLKNTKLPSSLSLIFWSVALMNISMSTGKLFLLLPSYVSCCELSSHVINNEHIISSCTRSCSHCRLQISECRQSTPFNLHFVHSKSPSSFLLLLWNISSCFLALLYIQKET